MDLDSLKWGSDGLIATVVTDADDGRLRMVGYSNRESLRCTLDTGLMHFWSRSRGKLWLKGESSNHFHHVVGIRYDCDGDALQFQVRADGPTCHTGEPTCFYRDLVADLGVTLPDSTTPSSLDADHE